MKIGIIGAGFTGLTSAYRLIKRGHKVVIFESNSKAGGLATGFRSKGWRWSLEKNYHHWFLNDDSILNLAKEIGQKYITIRPKTSIWYQDRSYEFDSPLSVLMFRKLSLVDKVRTGIMVCFLKLTPFWKVLEKKSAKKLIINWGGNRAWQILWEPLFVKKFGRFASKIPASWFWARIKKRTRSLCYPVGGFQHFVDILVSYISKNGGLVYFNHSVIKISKRKTDIQICTKKNTYLFDKVICTLPNDQFLQITKKIKKNYIKSKVVQPEGLGAVNLVLELKEKFLKDSTYWLNINSMDYPFLAIIEHTNFIDNQNYKRSHIIYIGNYLEKDHPFFTKTAKELLDIFIPFLQRINSNFSKEWVIGKHVFISPFAQPLVPLNYSKIIPKIQTPISGLYLANMQQVYPWDRGTNYAVEMGQRVANIVEESENNEEL